MSIRTALSRLLGSSAVALNGSSVNYAGPLNRRIEPQELPPAELYRLLRGMYLANGIYDDLARANVLTGRAGVGTKAIRNPVSTVCDFLGGKLLPDPLTVVTENKKLTPAIDQLWAWSNWPQSRRLFSRELALFGEVYLKAVASQERGRVYLQVVSPEHVTDFEADERGYLTMIRLDIPQCDEEGPERRYQTWVELWDQEQNQYRQWLAEGDAAGRAVKDLGTPVVDVPITSFGIDWLPFSRAVFRDLGEKRGIGAVQLALEAIFEADLSATNLHAMLYQDADGQWVATAAGMDANGVPIPPMRVDNATPTFDALGRQTSNGTGMMEDGSISVGKRSFWRLQPGYDLKSVVADIDYTAALAILQDHMGQLRKLMPSLAYAELSESGSAEQSGRAIRRRMSAAIDQIMEVRPNALGSLAQSHMQALTLGQINRIPGFGPELGSYEAGDFVHEFLPVDVVPIDDLERYQGELAAAQALGAWTTAGLPLAEALKRVGDYSEQEIVDILALAEAEANAAAERQADAFGDQGGQFGQQGQGGQQNAE